ncbi:MAG TPA: hypothetical protein VHH12_10905 [Mycobacterium sp.]|nr:hypothetical protein [Mycobacterium sp.]
MVIEQVAERLAVQYPNVGADTVAALVQQNHAQFSDSRIRDFIPLFVERRARRTLAELGS